VGWLRQTDCDTYGKSRRDVEDGREEQVEQNVYTIAIKK
jgi:hypothetical protein